MGVEEYEFPQMKTTISFTFEYLLKDLNIFYGITPLPLVLIIQKIFN